MKKYIKPEVLAHELKFELLLGKYSEMGNGTWHAKKNTLVSGDEYLSSDVSYSKDGVVIEENW